MKDNIISEINISKRISTIKKTKVILDSDLSELNNVTTKIFNQLVKRNISRFPMDFIFQLIKKEKNEVVTNCDYLNKLKFLSKFSYAFTEHGIAILSSVLKSDKTIKINMQIIRTFIKMKKMILSYKDLQYIIQKIETDLKSFKRIIIENNDNSLINL